MMLTFGVALIAGVYCLVRGAADFRQRKYVWASLGILAGIALIGTTPIPTHAEKVDLGIVPQR
jgi:hypothetical protein